MVFPIRSHILAPRVSVLETNGAITCLGQILSERRNTTFTVVSANDELQMLAGRGQHYETITFLRYLKYAAQGQRIIIPTKYVYFYIEKSSGLYRFLCGQRSVHIPHRRCKDTSFQCRYQSL